MNSLERVFSVIRGELPDRVPVFCNLLDQGALELGLTIEEYYSEPENVAEAQIRMQEKYGYDGIWAFKYMASIAEIAGCRRVIYSRNGPPNVGELVIRDFSDIETFEFPSDIEDTAAMQAWLRILDIIKNSAGGRVPVLSPVIASFTLPAILLGMEKWMELLFLGPAELRDVLFEKCASFNRRLIRCLRSRGADIIVYTNSMGTGHFLKKRDFIRICLPWIKSDLAENGGEGIVYFNGGGEINHIIDTLPEETGIGAFYLNPKDDPAEAKAIIGGRGIVVGCINDIRLIDWSEEQIRAEVSRIISAGKDGGGFFFGTLVMPFEIPPESIRIMLDQAFRVGSYA